VPASEKFTVPLSALHFRPDWSLSPNISGGRGEFPPLTPHWSGKNRAIPVLYGVEILTDDCFVTINASDRRKDGIARAIPCVALRAVAR